VVYLRCWICDDGKNLALRLRLLKYFRPLHGEPRPDELLLDLERRLQQFAVSWWEVRESFRRLVGDSVGERLLEWFRSPLKQVI